MNGSGKNLAFDVLIAVDIGVVFRSDFGRWEKWGLRPQDHVDYYVMTNEEVRSAVANAEVKNKGGAWIYVHKKRVSGKEAEGQYAGMSSHKNRFDHITAML
ncbi:MAG: hypothetical protein P1P84_24000 [Deferrisomatales bacterium]|nr:hypothetical protein [Deferrisomatales bacterium]